MTTVPKAKICDLSPSQSGILFDAIYRPGSSSYFVQIVYKIQGSLDHVLWKKSWHHVIHQNEALRACFVWENLNEPRQVIKEQVSPVWKDEGWQPHSENFENIIKLCEKERREGFNLSKPPLMRFNLIQETQDLHYFIWNVHHLIVDGWSLTLILEEVNQVYKSFVSGEDVIIQKKPEYRAYLNWIQQQDSKRSIEYWNGLLTGIEPSSLPVLSKEEKKIETFHFSEAESETFYSLAKEMGVTLNSLFQFGWGFILGKKTNSRDVVFGTVSSGRQISFPHVEKGIGLYVATFPVRVMFSPRMQVVDAVKSVQSQLAHSQENACVSLSEIQKEQKTKGGGLFNTLFIFENYPVGQAHIQDERLKISPIFSHEETEFPLTIAVIPGSQVKIKFTYDPLNYSPDEIELFFSQFQNLCRELSSTNNSVLGNLLLTDFHSVAIGPCPDECSRGELFDLFKEQVEKQPDFVALMFEDNQLTYKEIEQRVQKVVFFLQQKGLKPEDLICVMMANSADLIISYLSLLYMGCTIVPVDPSLPIEKIKYIFSDSKAKRIIFSEKAHLPLISGVSLDSIEEALAIDGICNLEKEFQKRNDLFCVIYTSGSTGKSKGVAISQKSFLNRVYWMYRQYPFSRDDVVVQKTSPSFADSLWEFFGPLCGGIKLVIFNKNRILDVPQFCRDCNQKQVSHLIMVPSYAESLIDSGERIDLKLITVSGEKASQDLLHRLYHQTQTQILNIYGSSEVTADATFMEFDPKERFGNRRASFIGGPIDYFDVYVLGEILEPLPPYSIGQICIAGKGLSYGYFQLPGLTAEKFVANPFQSGQRLFLTGDLGRFHADGRLEYLGRRDSQIKLRGIRIEPGEIAFQVKQYPGIKDAVVLLDTKDSTIDSQLVCYYISALPIDTSDLREFLGKNIASFMIPSFFIGMSKFPLNASGKIDRSGFPRIEIGHHENLILPSTELEKEILDIWKEVLSLQNISVQDHFFHIGGHSLLATKVASRIRKRIKKNVSIKALFDNPTIESIAKYIERAEEKELNTQLELPKFQKNRPEQIPLSFDQRRLWFLDKLNPEHSTYTVSYSIELTGALSPIILQKSLDAIVKKHEIFRSVILENQNGEPYQQILPKIDFFEFIDFSNSISRDKIDDYQRVLENHKFDLAKGPLFLASLVKTSENQFVLHLLIHHIIFDGWSLEIFCKELGDFYQRIKESSFVAASSLPFQFADYCIWQSEELKGDWIKQEIEFWKNKLEGAPLSLSLPMDFRRPKQLSYQGGRVSIPFSNEFSKQIEAFCQKKEVSLYMVVLSALDILLSKLSGSTDILVGSPVANRHHEEFEGVIGFFVNTMISRTQVLPEKQIDELLSEIKKDLLESHQHQNLPFEKIVEALSLPRFSNQNPVFQVRLVVHDRINQAVIIPGIDARFVSNQVTHSKFDLLFRVFYTTDGKISLHIEYLKDLFLEETIELFGQYLHRILSTVVLFPEKKIKEIRLDTSAGDKHQSRQDKTVPLPLISHFEKHARKTPDRIFAVSGNEQISFGYLNELSESIAAYIQLQGGKVGDVIGVCLPRGIPHLAALLGIMKIGAVFLPIDPDLPDERLKYMIHNSSTVFVIGDSLVKTRYTGPYLDIQQIFHSSNDRMTFQSPSIPLINLNAYIIYTSGTTGKPKGVVVSHLAIMNYVISMENQVIDSHRFCFGYLNAPHADLGYTALFAAIYLGARLYLEDPDTLLNIETVLANIYRQKIDFLKLTPSYSKLFIEKLPKDLQLILGGEPVLEKYLDLDREITNHYGPTETTIGVMTNRLMSDKVITIGKPILNTNIYILDDQLEPVGTGAVGEIYISGRCISRGYVNQPAQTAEKFIANPFSHGEVMYKTGDLGRFLTDGRVEFLGRKDLQVKIRGFRVECEEVTSLLRNHGDLTDVYVTSWKRDLHDELLIAYCVAGQFEPSEVELQDYLGEFLPEYMIPTHFIFLKSLPLNLNGKVDLQALPKPSSCIESNFEAPRDEFEKLMCNIWEEVLKLERIGISDNFFKIGGHSLIATQVISRIRTNFHQEVKIATLFENPTIASLCIAIRDLDNSGKRQLKPLLTHALRPSHPPLSFSQSRLWFLDHLYPDLTLYNMPLAIQIDGELDVNAVENAFEKVLARHEILRTVFCETEIGELFQKVQSTKNPLEIKDLTLFTDPAEELKKEKNCEENWHFDLSIGPLVRGKLLKVSNCRYALIVTFHHIICDGLSIDIFFKELWSFYIYQVGRLPYEIPSPSIQYIDYSIWQNQCFQDLQFQDQLQYWIGKLQGVSEGTMLPTDYPRPKILNYKGGVEVTLVPKEFSKDLKRFSIEDGVSMHMIFLAAFNVLLSKIASTDDVVIGVPVASRHHQELENAIGFFVNTLVSRVIVRREDSFRTLLKSVKQDTLESSANQDIPFEAIVNALTIERITNRNPLFQILFNSSPKGEQETKGLEGLVFSNIGNQYSVSKFDLELNIQELDRGGYSVSIRYMQDLFSSKSIQRWLNYYFNILTEIISNPDKHLYEISLESQDPRNCSARLCGPVVDFAIDSNLCALFDDIVKKKPDQIAVVSSTIHLTYEELSRKASQLANYLLTCFRLEAEDRVALFMERSEWMPIAIFAVLKAGGVFVPIDPDLPPERLDYLLKNTQAKCILTCSHQFAVSLEDVQVPVSNISALNMGDFPLEVNTLPVRAQNLAYILYTSGTTGMPKGVAITHRSLLNRLHFLTRALGEDVLSRILQKTPYIFDVSIVELLFSLLSGGLQVLASPGIHKDPWGILGLIQREMIETIHFVPSMAKNFLEVCDQGDLKSLKNIFLSGETLSGETLQGLFKRFPGVRIINLYGPTETTIDSTYLICKNGEPPSIGTPIDNTQVTILDRDLLPTPRGSIGNLYIGGEGLARGYFNRPDLTAERFIADPINRGKRIYHTGDLARIREDETIEFLGRGDFQVKIRGYRIELGEIESAIESIDAVQGTAVVFVPPEKLVAYYLGEFVAPTIFREHLQKTLPNYMIPVEFVHLQTFPLTPTGKLDRKALSAIQISSPQRLYARPREAVENELVEIWSELLGNQRIGIHDNFFEIGGHSLIATQVISRIRRRFELEIQLVTIFEKPTIAELASAIGDLRGNKKQLHIKFSLTQDRPQYPPLSPSQHRLWFLDKLIPDATVYNMFFSFDLLGKLDCQSFELALLEVCQRHESLRTTIKQSAQGDLYQFISPTLEILERIDFRRKTDVDEELKKLRTREESWRFDLMNGPLIRTKLVCLSEDHHVFLMTLHHIICDGWSVEILFREISQIYNARIKGQKSLLSAVNSQYIDYCLFLEKTKQSKELTSQLQYWKEKLQGIPDLIALPTDYPRPIVLTYQGGHYIFDLSSELSNRAKKFCHSSGISLYMLFLASVDILLNKLSGMTDIVVGSPISNRPYEEVEGTVGFFVNTLVSRAQVDANKKILEFISEVKSDVLEAMNHQDISFEQIVDALSVPRSTSRNPVFQVRLVVNEQNVEGLLFEGIQTQFLPPLIEQSKFDLLFRVFSSRDDKISIRIEYLSELFSEKTIKLFGSYFSNIIEGIVDCPTHRIGDLTVNKDPAMPVKAFSSLNIDSIIDRFEKIVEINKDVIALVHENRQLSYGELNSKADQLALYLDSQGVRIGGSVAIVIERGVDFVIAIFATLKIGCAFVPIDPKVPEIRRREMISESQCLIALVSDLKSLIDPFFACQIAEMNGVIFDENSIRSKVSIPLRQPAYTIYTSGSSGRPKGVIIDHQAVMNYVDHMPKLILNGQADCFGFMNVTSADLGFTALLIPLLTGKRLYILPIGLELEPKEATRLLEQEGVDILKLTPSHFKVLEEDLSKNIQIVLGGEIVSQSFVSKGFRLVNHYGPSETTIGVCAGRLSEGKKVTIGRPIETVNIYILDRNLAPVGVRIVGDLYIGGSCLSQGYIARPDLTAERFIASPFSIGERMYETGDLARYTVDGEIELLGRADDQVKIRGFRVELSEIRFVLEQHGDIKDAYVTSFQDRRGDLELVAYCIPGNFQPTGVELQDYLSEKLPSYMIPSFYEFVDSFPLLPNGKIDRKKFQSPEVNEEVMRVAPRSDFERKMRDIWKSVLNLDELGITENFFKVGGHSLIATQVISRIRSELGHEIRIATLFNHPTIEALCSQIKENEVPILTIVEDAGKKIRPQYPPLSFAQQRLWFLERLFPEKVLYNMPFAFRLSGPVNIEAFEASIKTLIQRHEILRVTIGEDVENQGYQKELADPNIFKWIDVSDKGLSEEAIERMIAEEGSKKFDLSNGPLIRILLIRIFPDESLLCITIHHIICDGWSIDLLFKEVSALYAHNGFGDELNLPEVAIQYLDYAIWQREYLKGDLLKKQQQFWQNKLYKIDGQNELTTDFPRPKELRYEGDFELIDLSQDLCNQMISISQKLGVSSYMLILTSIHILFQKISLGESIPIGSPIANRQHQNTEQTIGLFVNTIVNIFYSQANQTFENVVQLVKESLLEVYHHQDIPFEYLVDTLSIERAMNRNPLFQVMYTHKPRNSSKGLTIKGARLSNAAKEYSVAKLDLEIVSYEKEDQTIGIKIKYLTELYKAQTIRDYLKAVERILYKGSKNPNDSIGNISITNDVYRVSNVGRIQDEWMKFPEDASIHAIFERQVEETPDAVALVYKDHQVTYRELNNLSSRVACLLQIEYGISLEDPVAVVMDRSEWMLIAILGILKAGAAYVPIDPEFPKLKIHELIGEVSPKLILSATHEIDEILCHLSVPVQRLSIRKLQNFISKNDRQVVSSQLSYIIFTSGTTGKSKGVMISHRAVINHATWLQKSCEVNSTCRILLKTPFIFDVSVSELFPVLMTGGTLVIVEPGQHKEPETLRELILDEQISHINFVPSMIAPFLSVVNKQELSSLKYLLSCGERLLDETVHQVREKIPEAFVVNLYGPTETTVNSTSFVCSNIGQVCIGEAISNTNAYVLDLELNAVLPGALGELFIGGEGLARGYFKRPDLTASRFIASPFHVGKFLYRTGDLVRADQMNRLQYIGRKDHQVKLKGFRVELGAIESALVGFEGIEEAVVAVKKNQISNSDYLVGYYTSKDPIDKDQLKTYLENRFPEYMVPKELVELEVIPTTRSGKVNRSALPEPNQVRNEVSVLPRNALEEGISDVWKEVLGLSSIGIQEDFFHLGGDSIISMKIASRLRSRLQFSVSIRDILEYRTIERLANHLQQLNSSTNLNNHETYIESLSTDPRQSISRDSFDNLTNKENIEEVFLASSLQQGFIYHSLKQGETDDSYRVQLIWSYHTKIDPDRLKKAWQCGMKRFGALRLRFAWENELVQIIDRECEIDWRTYDVSKSIDNHANEVRDIQKQERKQSYDLSKGRLWRVSLIKISEEHYTAIFSYHHAILDGWSSSLLRKYVHDLYLSDQELELEKITPDKSYEKVQLYLQNHTRDHSNYWHQLLSQLPDKVDLTPLLLRSTQSKLDTRNINSSYSYDIFIQEEKFKRLKAFCRTHGLTLNSVVQYVWHKILSVFGNSYVTIAGITIFGRDIRIDEAESAIGLCINTLPLLVKHRPNQTVVDANAGGSKFYS